MKRKNKHYDKSLIIKIIIAIIIKSNIICYLNIITYLLLYVRAYFIVSKFVNIIKYLHKLQQHL